MSNKRKAAWRFTAVWTFPGNMVATISTDPIVSQNEVRQMETELKRLVLHAQRFPPHLRNIQLKYKLSDWELAQTKIPIQMPVQGYIQSQNNYSIDFHNLNQWFNANWSPVENQLRRDATYLAWVEDDPAYRPESRASDMPDRASDSFGRSGDGAGPARWYTLSMPTNHMFWARTLDTHARAGVFRCTLIAFEVPDPANKAWLSAED